MGRSPFRGLVITALVVAVTLLPACDSTDPDPAADTDQFSASCFRWSAATNHTTQYSSQREWDWAPDVGYYEGEPL